MKSSEMFDKRTHLKEARDQQNDMQWTGIRQGYEVPCRPQHHHCNNFDKSID